MPSLPQSGLRRSHQRQLVEVLRRHGPRSRAALSRAIGVSAVTGGRIVDELIGSGILIETSALDAGPIQGVAPGRPAQPVAINGHTARIILAELSRSRIRLAASPLAAARDDLWQHTRPMPRTAATLAKRLREAKAAMPDLAPLAVAVSVPGVTDEAAGRVVYSPNAHWLEQIDLPGAFGQVWDAPVCLVQEERAAALAHWAGRPERDDFLLVDLHEGVGGAAIVGGRLFEAASPLSVEVGHIRLPGVERACGCGATGCLETLASRRGLLRSFRDAHGKPRATREQMLRHIEIHGIETWLDDTLLATGATIGGALNILGLDHVVVTGWVHEMPEPVWRRLVERIEEASMHARFGGVRCERAPTRRAAGLLVAVTDRILLPDLPTPARLSA